MFSPQSPGSSIAIWERAIQPARRTLDAASARALLNLKLSKRDLDRADELAETFPMGRAKAFGQNTGGTGDGQRAVHQPDGHRFT